VWLLPPWGVPLLAVISKEELMDGLAETLYLLLSLALFAGAFAASGRAALRLASYRSVRRRGRAGDA
jgi:hypothetical protein